MKNSNENYVSAMTTVMKREDGSEAGIAAKAAILEAERQLFRAVIGHPDHQKKNPNRIGHLKEIQRYHRWVSDVIGKILFREYQASFQRRGVVDDDVVI